MPLLFLLKLEMNTIGMGPTQEVSLIKGTFGKKSGILYPVLLDPTHPQREFVKMVPGLVNLEDSYHPWNM